MENIVRETAEETAERLSRELFAAQCATQELTAQHARLEREANWLACQLESKQHNCGCCCEHVCSTSCGYTGPDNWRQAAKEAIDAEDMAARQKDRAD